MNSKLEQDLRLFKKFHDEQFEQQIKTNAANVDQLQTEIRTLKQTCAEQANQVSQITLKDKHQVFDMIFYEFCTMIVNFLLVSQTNLGVSYMSRTSGE